MTRISLLCYYLLRSGAQVDDILTGIANENAHIKVGVCYWRLPLWHSLRDVTSGSHHGGTTILVLDSTRLSVKDEESRDATNTILFAQGLNDGSLRKRHWSPRHVTVVLKERRIIGVARHENDLQRFSIFLLQRVIELSKDRSELTARWALYFRERITENILEKTVNKDYDQLIARSNKI